MKKSILLVIMLVFLVPAFAQVVIDETDMPKEGDTLRTSAIPGVTADLTQTGPNMTWDFSTLNKITQQVNSFVNVLNTPSLYWFTFIPGIIANLASPGANISPFPGIPLSNNFTFYNKSASLFSDVGYAFQLSGIPIMLKYDSADVYYTLPCTMGDTWTSHSFVSLTIPGMAYFSSSRNRTSLVDGWGSLITPFGTFETIRVKSEVIEHDSIFLDTLGIGRPYTRNITEYKWLGKGQGIPLLQINEEGLTKTAIYRDIVDHTGIHELRKESVQVFPNPSSGFCTIYLEGTHFPAHMQILNTQGSIVMDEDLPTSLNNSTSFDLSDLPTGLYFIRLIDKEVIYTGKVLIIR